MEEVTKTKKICTKCNEEKELSEFGKCSARPDGFMSICKECRKVIYKHISDKYTKSDKCKAKDKNRDKIKQKKTQERGRERNREKIRERDNKRYAVEKLSNPEKRESYNKEYHIKNRVNNINRANEYFKNNTEKVKNYRNKRYRDKYKNDILFKLKANSRGRLKHFLKSINKKINTSSLELIGCTPEELKIHIEKQFTVGMSWDNYGTYGDYTWNIDHRIPLSSAKTEDDIYTLSHYTNLQPMWSKENLKKGNKIIIND